MRTIEGRDVAVAIDAPPDVRRALGQIGRTEDVRFAPGSDRLAVAGFARNVVVSFDVEIAAAASIRLTTYEELQSTRIAAPHGVEFLDGETLVVANRGGDLEVVRLAGRGSGERSVVGSSGGHRFPLLREPSLVRVARDGCDLTFVIGSNGGESITVHRASKPESGPLDVEADGAHLGGIAEPDGVALSSDGRWLAVSAHGMRAVLVYDRTIPLGPATPPTSVLRGPMFPHGVSFAPGGEALLVADAGRPFVHVFERHGLSWSGMRRSDLAVRVMDDATFERGHGNPQEGGPKGVDVDPTGRVLVTTCKHLPLAAFDLGAIRARCPDAPPDDASAVESELALIRDVWRDLHSVRVSLSSLRRSRVLRATAPIRTLYRRWFHRGAHEARTSGP